MLRYVDLSTNRILVPAPPISASLPAGSVQPLTFATWNSTTLGAIKRGNTLTLQIQFIQNNVVTELSAGAVGILGFKQVDQHNAPYCASANWVKSGSGTTTIYTFTVTFLSSVLNALFLAASDPNSIDLISEIQWTDSNGTHETLPDILLTVLNDVIQS